MPVYLAGKTKTPAEGASNLLMTNLEGVAGVLDFDNWCTREVVITK